MATATAGPGLGRIVVDVHHSTSGLQARAGSSGRAQLPRSAGGPGRPIATTAAARGDAGSREAGELKVEQPKRVKRVLKAAARPAVSSDGHVDYEQQNERELHLVVEILPEALRAVLRAHPEYTQLVEVIMDVGRVPIARFPSGDVKLALDETTFDDIDDAVAQIGDFGEDNRAGIDRCLHRISCMRNRRGRIVGLTCRIGRVVPGTAQLVGDLVGEGRSVLLLGCPGVGKTTALRDICRLLSEEAGRRVVAVDTSNEIGGDGDIPHHAVGRARRMQVPRLEQQHAVMIEAVENHMPEVIVIDEIGTEAEALAARTIAERGVQLVATCHGSQLENVVRNPTLNALVGGIGSVTLGDEGARMRGTQKTVLERQGPPAFSAVAEMVERNRWVVHHDTGRAVDMLLAGRNPCGEVRELKQTGEVTIAAHWEADEQDAAARMAAVAPEQQQPQGRPWGSAQGPPESVEGILAEMNDVAEADFGRQVDADAVRLFCVGVEEHELLEAAEDVGLSNKVSVVDALADSDAVLSTRAQIKADKWVRKDAAAAGVPIFALRSGSSSAVVRALRQILGIDPSPAGAIPGDQSRAAGADPALVASQRDAAALSSNQQAWGGGGRSASAAEKGEAEEEARMAIENIVVPRQQPIELRPHSLELIELQVRVAEQYGLVCERAGSGQDMRLRILPQLV